jgi:hypothetical protein
MAVGSDLITKVSWRETMADYTAAETADLKKLMAKGRITKLRASSVFALGQKMQVPCKLKARFRAGMTNAERNEAFDGAMQKYVDCLVRSVS